LIVYFSETNKFFVLGAPECLFSKLLRRTIFDNLKYELNAFRKLDDPGRSLPFIREILSSLRKEVDGKAALIGFVGTPWTLAAYAMEGMSDKNLMQTKTIMLHRT
jgi:uroporphyrinogen-III decarboxylase